MKALEFAKEGSNVIATGRRIDKLQSLAKEIQSKYPKSKVYTLEMDVRARDAVNKAVASLPKEFSEVDVLVNNAGLVQGMDTIEKVNDHDIDVMFDTNVKGLLYVTQGITFWFCFVKETGVDQHCYIMAPEICV